MSAGPSDAWTWLAILAVSSTTLLTRCSFLVLGERARLPPVVERALRYAPAAALAALIGPDLLAHRGEVDVGLDNWRLYAGLVAVAAFAVTRSMIWTIVVGMAAYTALRLWT
jgi:branched-subunit amino acid transport protein